MDLLNKEKILRVMSVTRYHFVAGMPHAGVEHLLSILSQNPSLVVRPGSPAEEVFSDLVAQITNSKSAMGKLPPDSQRALLRGSLDAVHHSRSMDGVVLDENPHWMGHIERLADLFPLSRFVFMVRDPAAIAADLAEETGRSYAPKSLMADDGPIGRPLLQLHEALNGPEAERVLLIDRDRLVRDPVHVLDVLYRFLRVPVFEHNLRELDSASTGLDPRIGPGRRVVSLDASTRKKPSGTSHIPVWRRTPRTEATMLLAESG